MTRGVIDLRWSFLVFILFLLPTHSFAVCDITDDIGQALHFSTPAQRIVSLAPDITEILFSIGAGDRVMGVVMGSDYPQEARKIPQIGSYSGLDLERIVSLHPDLIVTWSRMFSRQLTVLKKMGIPVYTTEPRRLEDIPRTMKNLGCLTGTMKIAERKAKQYDQRLSELHKKYHTQKPITVFYQIGSYSLITINRDSWINQVITLCGGRNIFANANFIAPEVSWEAVVAANPHVIISDVMNESWKKHWMARPYITAVKNHLLFAVHPDIISRAGPRLLEGVEQVCADLQVARSVASASSPQPSPPCFLWRRGLGRGGRRQYIPNPINQKKSNLRVEIPS